MTADPHINGQRIYYIRSAVEAIATKLGIELNFYGEPAGDGDDPAPASVQADALTDADQVSDVVHARHEPVVGHSRHDAPRDIPSSVPAPATTSAVDRRVPPVLRRLLDQTPTPASAGAPTEREGHPMTTTTSDRAEVFTGEQAARAEALRTARDVLALRALITAKDIAAAANELVDVADYIVNGVHPLARYDEPGPAAVTSVVNVAGGSAQAEAARADD